MPMFVSTATIRRGTAAAPPPLQAGSMHSSNGRAIATPPPRRNVRRDNTAEPTENRECTFVPLFGEFRSTSGQARKAAALAGSSAGLFRHSNSKGDARQAQGLGDDSAQGGSA